MSKIKLAILSDIHANYEGLTAVLKHAQAQDIQQYILLGDYIDYGANPNEVLQQISKLDILLAILGNHDDAILRDDCSRFRTYHGKKSFEWTRGILTEASMCILKDLGNYEAKSSQYSISLYHGNHQDILWGNVFINTPESELLKLLEAADTQIVLVGHSHLQFCMSIQGKFIINPGSVGQPRNGDNRAQYAILDTETLAVQLHRVEYNYGLAALKIFNNNINPFLAHRLFLGI